MPYILVVTPAAQRDLKRLPPYILKRVDICILSLVENARPHGCRKLTGSDNLWRVRVGNYRIIYTIQDKELVIIIIRVRHRREAYD